MSIPLFGCNTNLSEEKTDYYNEVKGLWQLTSSQENNF